MNRLTLARKLLFLCYFVPALAHAQGPLLTRWTSQVNPAHPLQEYPRPQLVRGQWQNLNGLWEYAITEKVVLPPQKYDGTIVVPYPIESMLSGVKKTLLPSQILWYKRTISVPVIKKEERALLQFGAVDWQATVYVNGQLAGTHTGGYQQFTVDITDKLKAGLNELVVSVFDPTNEGPNPHGKQTLQPQGIFYTPTSGIWQTVWLEIVPAIYIKNLQMTPEIDSNHLRLRVNTNGASKDYTIEAVTVEGQHVKGKPDVSLVLPVPDAHYWSPEDPYLYQLKVRLLYKGKPIDTVSSYFGMRKIDIQKDSMGIERLFLNNKYTYHLGVLDQGFWPDGLYTAPTDEALAFDIRAVRNMGFNTIRKHIKIEPDRWYYHADRLGVLVWQDMVNCADKTPIAKAEFEQENIANVKQLYNHPSIVIWVLFNEGWQRYDQERLTKAMKLADPSRLVNGHSGENYDRDAPKNPREQWIASDLVDVHDYPGPGMPPSLPGKARVLGEWGGVRVSTLNHQWSPASGWGYIQVPAAEFTDKYAFMLKHLKINEAEGLSGSIYTQPFDVESEENGLITYDREVIKIPSEKLRQLHHALQPNADSYADMLELQLADTANPERKYHALQEEYKQGKRAPEFLRMLITMADQVYDDRNAALYAGEFLKAIADPYRPSNLLFISKYTNSVMDPGFRFFQQNAERIDQVMGPRQAEMKMMNIIYEDEVKPFLENQGLTPDWSMFEKHITTLYGDEGEEIYLRSRTIHSLNNDNWADFAIALSLYLQKYGDQIPAKELNTFGTYVKTNADRLYKEGRKKEAIAWQEKALAMVSDKEKAVLKADLEKMKNN
jgi:hypothetical protein